MLVQQMINVHDAWKNAYDDFASVRKTKGVTGASVHHDAKDPNLVVVTHQFKDAGAATSFTTSEELKSTMSNVGVSGAPEIWFCNDGDRERPDGASRACKSDLCVIDYSVSPGYCQHRGDLI